MASRRTSSSSSTTIKVEVGTSFYATYADSQPLWRVMSKRVGDTWNCEVVDSPDWKGTKKVFSSEEIRRYLAFQNVLNDCMDSSDRFYAGLQPGYVVHYADFTDRFVRCIVVREGNCNNLKPIALVGKWDPMDVARRALNGSVVYGYHAQKILAGETFHPHAGNIYEYARKGEVNPATLPPKSLTLPEMTPEEKQTAALWQAVEEASKALGHEGSRDPRKRLEAAQKVIQEALGR